MSKSGRTWREIQEKIRPVLNSVWDPIGVADVVDDEAERRQEVVSALRALELPEFHCRG